MLGQRVVQPGWGDACLCKADGYVDMRLSLEIPGRSAARQMADGDLRLLPENCEDPWAGTPTAQASPHSLNSCIRNAPYSL